MIPGLALPRHPAPRRRSLPRLPAGRGAAGLQDGGENGFMLHGAGQDFYIYLHFVARR